jgi:hypothetical protein
MQPDWYQSTFFNWHVDYHIRPHSATGAGMTAERLRHILERVRPDMVQVDAKGHPGLSSYRSRYSPVSEHYAQDTLRLYRDITRELGLPFSVYYSTLIDNAAIAAHPEWSILQADGTPVTWFSEVLWNRLCFNSGYVDDYMLPQLLEITIAYEPDGFWMDGDAPTARLCYCPACQALFRARTGAALPTEALDPLWPEALQFVRDTYTRYVKKICDTIHDARPGCLVSINWLQTLRSPNLAPNSIDWLSGDVSVSRSPAAASAEARYIDGQAVPGDIMICQFTADESWQYLYYKTLDQISQDAAPILANGCRVFVWTSPMLDGSIHDDAVDLLAETASFIRARQPWSEDTTSVADVGVLLSSRPAQRSPHLRSQPPELDRVLAAQHWLAAAGWHHDLLSDHQTGDFERWHVIIAPDLADLSAETVAALIRYVESGGQLLAGAPLEAGSEGRVRADLALLTGIECATATGQKIVRSNVWGAPTRLFYDYWQLTGPELTPWGGVWDTQTGQRLGGQSEAVLHSLGAGRVLTLCGDVFLSLHTVPAPALSAMALRALRHLHPQPVAELLPAGQLEVSVRARSGEWLVHLINRGADRDMAGNSFFVERVPPTAPRRVRVRYPQPAAQVTLEPGGRSLAWTLDNSGVVIELPALDIHNVVRIQGPPL